MPRIARLGHVLPATIASILVTAAPAAATHTGGASAAPAPAVSAWTCKAGCVSSGIARPGSLVVVRGRGLDAATAVTFLGRSRRGDEATARPRTAAARWLTVRVPRRARTGRVVIAGEHRRVSRPSRAPVRISRAPSRTISSGNGPALDVTLTVRKAFFDAARRPAVSFTVHDRQPVHAAVEVVRVTDGALVATLDQGLVPPEEARTVAWSGVVNGIAAPDGRYEFNVVVRNDEGVEASSSRMPGDEPSPETFLLVGHKFPVRGKHDYGEHAASFGGGRGHKGHDVFAACGTPLHAARGGVVKIAKYESRAGNYVVIDGEKTDVDYAYMHLREPSPLTKGQRVRTGQLIGYVGDTGRASGCHLHFEMWSGPGWYTGGAPFDPLPHLKAWDRYS